MASILALGILVISRVLFEHPFLLFVLLVAIQFGLIVIWSKWRSRFCARAVWMGFAAIPLLPTVSYFVVTPREQVIELCVRLAGYIDRGELPGLGTHLADNFTSGHLTKERFLRQTELRLTRYRLDNIRLHSFEVSFVGPNRALAEFTVVCRIRSEDFYMDRCLSRWRVTFIGENESWKVTAIQSIRTQNSALQQIRDLLP